MSKKSSMSLQKVSPVEDSLRIELRKGQQDLVDYISTYQDKRLVNVKWPGGYGKSIGIALAYKLKRIAGICNRLLIVVANDTQLKQIRNDFKQDCADAGLRIKGDVWKFTKDASVLRVSIEGKAEVFVTTIHMVSSTNRADIDSLTQLMNSGGQWMLAADEYHHYATDADWGTSLSRLRDIAKFTVALSATPDRDGPETIFGAPHLQVSYREARKELAVKTLLVKKYHYTVDAIMSNGDIITYTTDELREIEFKKSGLKRSEEKYQLRYSSKYLHPLITNPMTRLTQRRLETGSRLQMLVRAISCKHAQMLNEQISKFGGDDLVTDWIGTGPDGRSDEDNESVRGRFCPPKDDTGHRPSPELDVLVQVGMAGEGFDCIPVAEIIDFGNPLLEGAGNQTKQFYKRGARWIRGLSEEHQVCHINVPSDHPLAGIEDQVMEWIDTGNGLDSIPSQREPDPEKENDISNMCPLTLDLFDKFVRDRKPELTAISDDSPHLRHVVSKIARSLESEGRGIYDVNDERDFARLRELYCSVAHSVAKEEHEQLTLEKARDRLNTTIGALARKAIISLEGRGSVEKSKLGDFCKRINGYIYKNHGKRECMLVEDIRRVAYDIEVWDQMLRDGERPPCL